MHIGLIVYSKTGNTLSVVQQLMEALTAKGHTVSVARVEGENDDPGSKQPPKVTAAPDPSSYDALVFAAPVHAFSLCPVMKLYLAQIPQIKGKKVCCFVTQHLKHKWMGGNRAVKQMSDLLKQKGAVIGETGVVNWSAPDRDARIADVVGRVSKCL